MAVFERDDFTCRDCCKEFDHPEPYYGEPIPGLTRGHIIPAAQGGTAGIDNLIAQCQPCNQALGNQVWNPDALSVPEWIEDAE
jgi:5-methylcytosine-specific restriction endonuclease McrA